MNSPLNTTNTVHLLENSSVFSQEIDEKQAQTDYEHKNLKKILLIVEKSDFLSSKNEELLRNIIKAVKLDWNDISVLEREKGSKLALSDLLKVSELEHVVLFGNSFKSLSLNLEDRLNYSFKIRGCLLIQTYSLEELNGTKAKKAALWSALQRQFKISA